MEKANSGERAKEIIKAFKQLSVEEMEKYEKKMPNVRKNIQKIQKHKNYNEDIESVIKKLDKEIDDYKLYERHLTSIYELMELGIKITALAYN